MRLLLSIRQISLLMIYLVLSLRMALASPISPLQQLAGKAEVNLSQSCRHQEALLCSPVSIKQREHLSTTRAQQVASKAKVKSSKVKITEEQIFQELKAKRFEKIEAAALQTYQIVSSYLGLKETDVLPVLDLLAPRVRGVFSELSEVYSVANRFAQVGFGLLEQRNEVDKGDLAD